MRAGAPAGRPRHRGRRSRWRAGRSASRSMLPHPVTWADQASPLPLACGIAAAAADMIPPDLRLPGRGCAATPARRPMPPAARPPPRPAITESPAPPSSSPRSSRSTGAPTTGPSRCSRRRPRAGRWPSAASQVSLAMRGPAPPRAASGHRRSARCRPRSSARWCRPPPHRPAAAAHAERRCARLCSAAIAACSSGRGVRPCCFAELAQVFVDADRLQPVGATGRSAPCRASAAAALAPTMAISAASLRRTRPGSRLADLRTQAFQPAPTARRRSRTG